jgi:hypothetical protein
MPRARHHKYHYWLMDTDYTNMDTNFFEETRQRIADLQAQQGIDIVAPVNPVLLAIQATYDLAGWGTIIQSGRIVLPYKTTLPFPTAKGNFFPRWNNVWGYPDPWENWGNDQNLFANWYFNTLNRETEKILDISDTPNWGCFDYWDDTISNIVNLEGDNTVIVRNAIAELIGKASGRVPSHNEALFGVRYLHWDTELKSIMRRHYKAYDIYCVIQESIIVPYWDARTAEETSNRQHLIQNIGLIVAGAALSIITAGFSTGILADAISKVVNITTDIDIPADAIKKGLDSISEANISLPSVGNSLSEGLNQLGTNISNINLTPDLSNINLIPDLSNINFTPELSNINIEEIGKNMSNTLNNLANTLTNTTTNTNTNQTFDTQPIAQNNEQINPEKFLSLLPLVLTLFFAG